MEEKRPVALGSWFKAITAKGLAAGPSSNGTPLPLLSPAESRSRLDDDAVSPADEDYPLIGERKEKQCAVAAEGPGISTANTSTVSAAEVNGHGVGTGAAMSAKGKGKQRADRAPLDAEMLPVGDLSCTQDGYGKSERQQQSRVFRMLETAPSTPLPPQPSYTGHASESGSSSPAFQDALSSTDPLRYYAMYCKALGVVEPGEAARPGPTSDSAIELDILKPECCGRDGCGSASAPSPSPTLDQTDLVDESSGVERPTADQPAEEQTPPSTFWSCIRLAMKIFVGILLVAAFGGAFVAIPLAPDSTAVPGPVNGTTGLTNGTITLTGNNTLTGPSTLTDTTSLTAPTLNSTGPIYRGVINVVRAYIPSPFTASLSVAQKSALCNQGIQTWCSDVSSDNATYVTPLPPSPSHGAPETRTPTFAATCAFLLCVVAMYCILHVALRWCLAGRRKGGSGGIIEVRSLALEKNGEEGWWEGRGQGFVFVAVGAFCGAVVWAGLLVGLYRYFWVG